LPLERTGLALRPSIYEPKDIVKLAIDLDKSESISHIFIPDIPGGFDSIEISSAALGATRNIQVGSGVIRPLEHDNVVLVRRLQTIQAISKNRYILGVGTGNPGPNPKATIESMLKRLQEIESSFRQGAPLPGVLMPDTYIAALRAGIAKRVEGHSTGILLNFCSPDHAKNLIGAYKGKGHGSKRTDFACYLKVFFSRDRKAAERMLIEEFVRYDTLPQYHDMFVQDGVAEDIAKAGVTLQSSESTTTEAIKQELPQSLLRICLANPDESDLHEYIKEFRKAGVTLPCVYPYFAPGDDTRFRFETVRRISGFVR
jgi:hypothetical protein